MSEQLTDMSIDTVDNDAPSDRATEGTAPPAEARPGWRLIPRNTRPARRQATNRDCGWYADRQDPVYQAAVTTA
jgi:hypothetical protein